MSEKYTKAMHEAYRKEQDEKAEKEKEERAERVAKTNARTAWLADGGSREAFEKAWPSLRDEGRKERVAEAGKSARQAQRDSGLSRI